MPSFDRSIEILWGNDALLAVDKPPGLPTQTPPGGVSLESRLRLQLPQTRYLAFPHRLDRPVGGVVLVALRKRAASLLSAQFSSRKIDKIYMADVIGRIEAIESHWSDWMRKIADHPRAEICAADAVGAKHAETDVRVVEYDAESDRTRLELMPRTGRMHQLRVQTAFRGHPIVDDRLYGPEDGDASEQEIPIRLHARSITFHDPLSGVRTTVSSPLPRWE